MTPFGVIALYRAWNVVLFIVLYCLYFICHASYSPRFYTPTLISQMLNCEVPYLFMFQTVFTVIIVVCVMDGTY